MENQGEIILYQPDKEVKLEVRLENETVWLNRQQLAELFARDVKTIGKHINNALKEELADIVNYAILIADKYDLDIKQIVMDKIRRNAEKYPVDKAYGSAKKYNEL